MTEADKRRVKKALALLVADPRHPSLQVKRIVGKDNIWEARASLTLRITFEMDGDMIILRNVGAHGKALNDA